MRSVSARSRASAARWTQVRQQVAFTGDLEAFFDHLETDPQFYFTQGTDVLSGYRELKKRIDATLPQAFSVFPKADYESA